MLSLSAQTTCNIVLEIFLIAILDLDDNGRKEGEPDDVEDEEESHEEVEDVVDGEHLNQLQRN